MREKVLGGARGALVVAAGAAKHLLWYVGYRVDGSGVRLDEAGARLRSSKQSG